jgi:hypothetical protein
MLFPTEYANICRVYKFSAKAIQLSYVEQNKDKAT